MACSRIQGVSNIPYKNTTIVVYNQNLTIHTDIVFVTFGREIYVKINYSRWVLIILEYYDSDLQFIINSSGVITVLVHIP